MTALYDQELVARLFEITGEPTGHFKPFAFHNKEGDCIEFFVSQDDYFSDRVDDYLTLYRDMDTERIVGFVIKNVKRITDRLSKQKSAMAFVIDDGKANLRCLFTALFANENPDADQEKRALIVREYRNVVEIAESNELDEVELACV